MLLEESTWGKFHSFFLFFLFAIMCTCLILIFPYSVTHHFFVMFPCFTVYSSELVQRAAINDIAESVMAFNTNYKDTGLFGVYAVAKVSVVFLPLIKST